MLTHGLPFGGVSTVIKSILENWNEPVSLFLFVIKRKQREEKIDYPDVIFSTKTSWLIFPTLFEIKKIILARNIGLIHCQGYPLVVIYASLLKILWFHDLKIIYHFHGSLKNIEGNHFLHGFYYDFLLKLFIKYIDLFIVVTKAQRKELELKYGNKLRKVVVMYNLLNLKHFAPENKIPSNDAFKDIGLPFVPSKTFIIGFAARLLPHKGWKDFLDAVCLVKEKYPEMKYLIASDGPDRQNLIRYIEELRLLNSVFYIGYVEHIINFYSGLDCFVMPSHWETMGLTQLEAQALGIPTICSNIECVAEVVENNVNTLLFPVGNSEELAHRMEQIYLDKPLREMLIKNGLENVKRFSPKLYVEKLNNIYTELLDK